MSPSKILFFLCVSFVLGIFLESLIKIPQIFLWVFLFMGLLAIVVSFFTKRDYFIIAGFCLLFLALGIIRLEISEFNIANDKLSKFNGKGQIVLTGIISNEPDFRDTSQKLKVKIGASLVLVTASRYPEFKYLDKIKITGKLETPTETEDFSYKNYLMKDGIYSVMGFPKIEKPENRDRVSVISRVYSGILDLKQKIRESVENNFLPPQSSILEGTLLGDNGALSNDLKNKLNITGLRHIIAVSGTHVVILSTIIMFILLAMGFWRGQAFYISLIFIFTYIILTGLPASGIRAGIMGGIYLLAQKLGRMSAGFRVITLACAIMLLANPLLLFYDVGFQLSFLAVLGMIFLEPIIKVLLKKIMKEKVKNLTSIVSTTLSAQIFTLPIMVYNFGNISFVSLLTNILVLPIVDYLMIIGFLSVFAGIFSNVLGWIISVPCWLLLTYFLKVIDIFSKPWAIKYVENVHWLWLLASYLIIFFATYFLNKKYSRIF